MKLANKRVSSEINRQTSDKQCVLLHVSFIFDYRKIPISPVVNFRERGGAGGVISGRNLRFKTFGRDLI